ncbi:fasciclin-1 [Caerostris extrusa]|uniref:Fasciclin-1 n=1 Tax=Caerostris extrusa TaxID=172846 RepID=A0AAV4Y069_CAEEX|nr:fasciclin-1 [Caerostris extrusa]
MRRSSVPKNTFRKRAQKQLLYVIDEILQPYVSSTSLPPTALDLLDKPELYDIREPLSAFDFRVKQEGLQELFRREGNNTFFLPVGAGVGHSFNRQQEVDKWVIRGHVVPRTILFTRLVSFDSYPSEAYGDDIKVELTIINESNAMGNSYSRGILIKVSFPLTEGVKIKPPTASHQQALLHAEGCDGAQFTKPNIPNQEQRWAIIPRRYDH